MKYSDCNNCGVDDCNSEFYEKMGTKCSAWRKPSTMKTPLLKHLMCDDVKAINCIKVLNNFKLSLKEISRYPGFKLEVK